MGGKAGKLQTPPPNGEMAVVHADGGETLDVDEHDSQRLGKQATGRNLTAIYVCGCACVYRFTHGVKRQGKKN